MTKPLILRHATPSDVAEMVLLLQQAHAREARHHQDFPPFDDVEASVIQQLQAWVKQPIGWIAEKNRRVIGFMVGIRIGPLFGNDPGLVIPAHGWSVSGNHRSDTLRALLEQVLEESIRLGHMSIAWTIPAHDRSALKIARDWGMGNRCSDALISVMDVNPKPSPWHIEHLLPSDLPRIASLHLAHTRFYRQAPMWMPSPDEDPLQDLHEWMTGEDRSLYAAFDGTRAIGYLRTQPHAESYVSHHPQLRNITAAYVDPAYRQLGVATALLDHAQADLRERGMRWCGVDYETINPSGSRFWERHFVPYTVSLTRRVDERITPLLKNSIDE